LANLKTNNYKKYVNLNNNCGIHTKRKCYCDMTGFFFSINIFPAHENQYASLYRKTNYKNIFNSFIIILYFRLKNI